MTMPIKWLPFIILLIALSRAEAQTIINAASCSAADVQKALNAVVADGTTVNIPAGNCTWTTPVTYNQTYSTIIQGAGAQTPQGGTDQTIIQDNINHSSGDPAIIAVTTAAGKSFRLTGLAFYGYSANSSVSYNGLVRLYGSSKAVRLDNCHFYHLNLVDIVHNGWLYGVIDHNLFDFSLPSSFGIRAQSSGWNGISESGPGDASWADDSHFGSNQFIFIENNTFQMQAGSGDHGFAFDCSVGGRFVFRYNNVGYHVMLQTHAVSGSSANGDNSRPCRAHEEYNNSFVYSSNPSSDYSFAVEDNESGSGLFYNNTVTGFAMIQREDTVRTNNATYTQTATPNGWGYCGTTLGPSAWDRNTDSTGYPCLDQVGRGKGDMLTGVFPNKVDSVTGKISWPNQKLDPWYMWNITYNAPPDARDTWWSNYDSVTVKNRDYYLQLPNYNDSGTFNGTAGMGVGLLSTRPTTCTTSAEPGGGVAYWATDTKTLYQCSATNTWTVYYTPYTYPHPLVSSTAGGTAPSAPSGLKAAVN